MNHHSTMLALKTHLMSSKKKKHVATGQGGRDQMMKVLSVKYTNILRDDVELFKSMCLECQKKRKRPMIKGVVVRPILTSEFA